MEHVWFYRQTPLHTAKIFPRRWMLHKVPLDLCLATGQRDIFPTPNKELN